MFRPILKQFRRSIDSIAFSSGYSARHRQVAEINEVKLVGTLINDAFVLGSGSSSLNIKTETAPDSYQFHTVRTRGFDNLKAGQRVYVSGFLSSTSFQLENGKRRERSVVRARKVFIFEEPDRGGNNRALDRNQVNLVGNIVADVFVDDKTCAFKMATNTSNHSQYAKADFHSVFVYDDELRKFVMDLKERDRVVVQGECCHRPYIAADGTKMYAGYVIATHIGKTAL